MFPSGIKIVTTKDHFNYKPRTAKEIFSNLKRSASAGVIVQRPDFSSNATFPDGKIQSIENIVEILKKCTVFNKPLLRSSCEQKRVDLLIAEGYHISVQDRSLLDVLGLSGVTDTNRGRYFIGTHNNVRNQTKPMKGDFLADILSGTEFFFVNCNIIE